MVDEDQDSSASSSISVISESLDGHCYDELPQERQVVEAAGGAAETTLIGSPPNTVISEEHLYPSTSSGAVAQLSLKRRILKGIAKSVRIRDNSQNDSSQFSGSKIIGEAEKHEFETNQITSIPLQHQ